MNIEKIINSKNESFENKVNSIFNFIYEYHSKHLQNLINVLDFESYLFLKFTGDIDNLNEAREALEDIGFFCVIEFNDVYSFLKNIDIEVLKKDIQTYL